MLQPIDREDTKEMERFLEDNISFGIDDIEQRFLNTLTHFMPLTSFDTPQKHHKTRG